MEVRPGSTDSKGSAIPRGRGFTTLGSVPQNSPNTCFTVTNMSAHWVLWYLSRPFTATCCPLGPFRFHQEVLRTEAAPLCLRSPTAGWDYCPSPRKGHSERLGERFPEGCRGWSATVPSPQQLGSEPCEDSRLGRSSGDDKAEG